MKSPKIILDIENINTRKESEFNNYMNYIRAIMKCRVFPPFDALRRW